MVAFCGMSIDNSRKHKNCFSSALGMLGITFHKNPFLICLESAVRQTVQTEHQMMSCSSKVMKKKLSMSESVGSE
jgi:hypothetical protein